MQWRIRQVTTEVATINWNTHLKYFQENHFVQQAGVDKQVSAKLPYKLETNWVDGGYCTLGDGEAQRKIRLMLDLGAQRSYGSRSLFKGIAKDIRKGNLGAARREATTRVKVRGGHEASVGQSRGRRQ